MRLFSRRQAIRLASSFVSAPLFASRAPAQAPSPPGATVLDIKSFSGPGVDPDATFAKAIAQIDPQSSPLSAFQQSHGLVVVSRLQVLEMHLFGRCVD